MRRSHRVKTWMRAHLMILAMVAGIVYGPYIARAQACRSAEEPEVSPVIAELIKAHNRERGNAGLPPLQRNSKLTAAARLHAQDMAQHKTLSHRGSDKTTPAQRVEQQEYPYQKTGENVASGQPTPKTVMQAWMRSPHHRQNILGDFTEIGAARGMDQQGTPYWCVVFGLPMPTLKPTQAAATLVSLFNQKRAARGIPALTAQTTLHHVAQDLAQAMAEQDTLQPKGEDADTLQKRLQQAGYPAREVSQSAVSGQPTPQAVLQRLLGTKGSQNNMLGSATDVGVGYATAHDGMPYWCVIFATRRP